MCGLQSFPPSSLASNPFTGSSLPHPSFPPRDSHFSVAPLSLWSPKLRSDLVSALNPQSVIFLEPDADIVALVGSKSGMNLPRVQTVPLAARTGLNDLRLILYQLIGHASLHKVLFVEPSVALDSLAQSFLTHLLGMENRSSTSWCLSTSCHHSTDIAIKLFDIFSNLCSSTVHLAHTPRSSLLLLS
jgi:hypothetical protein